jgi:hypothetical protein
MIETLSHKLVQTMDDDDFLIYMNILEELGLMRERLKLLQQLYVKEEEDVVGTKKNPYKKYNITPKGKFYRIKKTGEIKQRK